MVLKHELTYFNFYLEKSLGAMLREMFVIGAESESVMMRWALRLLSVFTEAQSKVQAEIDQIIGPDRDINWDDRHQLPITRATLAEIQRFADIAPTAVGHKVMYDVDFHGFHLPKVGIRTQIVKSNSALRERRSDISNILWHLFSRKLK